MNGFSLLPPSNVSWNPATPFPSVSPAASPTLLPVTRPITPPAARATAATGQAGLARSRPKDKLEDDLRELYEAWQKDPDNKENNAKLLDALQPTIEKAIYRHTDQPNPNLMSRARLLALRSLKTYDPKKSQLRTHVTNHMLGLRRYIRHQQRTVYAPERLQLDRQLLDDTVRDLFAELGREPTDQEICERTGFSAKRLERVRSYRPSIAEGYLENFSTEDDQIEGPLGGVIKPNAEEHDLVTEMVYDELDSYHQKVMEYAFGLHGHRKMSNQEIAAKLKRSPGAISQAKKRIQEKLDELRELEPFA